ncbi:hypothetical protein [Nostoc sp. C052]|nr:hypothetical protein [Nostoc sp. C052]
MGSQPPGWEPVRAKLIAFLSAIRLSFFVISLVNLFVFIWAKAARVGD